MNRQFDTRFDELFNQKFSGFEKTPPDYILDNVKTSVFKHPGLSKIGNFFKNNLIVAGLSFIVPAFIIGFYAFSGEKNDHVKKNINIVQAGVIPEKNVIEPNKTNHFQNNVSNNSIKPVSKFFTDETCGLTYLLKSNSNNGKWTCDDAIVNFTSANNRSCIVGVPTDGTYNFKWLPSDNAKCIEYVTVKFNKLPAHDKIKEIVTCGNEVAIEASRSNGSGIWSSLNNINFKNAVSAKTIATYNGTGKVNLIWTENDICAFADTFSVVFSDKPDATFDLASPVKCADSPMILAAKNKSLAKYEWDLDGGVAKDLTANTVNVSWKEGLKHTVTLKTWTKDNCFSSFSSVIDHPKPIDVSFDVQPATCVATGSIKAIPADTKAVYQYFWLKDLTPSDLFKKDLASGKYQVTVRENGACSREFFVDVPGAASVKASFYHSNYESSFPTTVYFVNTSALSASDENSDELKHQWDFGDGTTSDEESPKHTYTSSGTFKVKLTTTSRQGCTDTYVDSDIIIDPLRLSVPNVFSPNGDGKNDVFRVKATSLSEFHAVVSGAKGEKVFEWFDPEAGWDGTILKSGAKAVSGIYYYIVTAVGKDGSRYEDKGAVQLVRD